jgi:hypothetical protein
LPPVTFDHIDDHLAQSIALGRRKVGFLFFGENRQNKDGQALSAKQINNSRAAALTSRAEADRTLRIPPLPGMIPPHLGSAARRSTIAARSVGENNRTASAR